MGKWLYRLHVELLLVPPIEVPLGLHDGSPWWFLVVLGLFNNHAEFRIALSIFKPTPNIFKPTPVFQGVIFRRNRPLCFPIYFQTQNHFELWPKVTTSSWTSYITICLYVCFDWCKIYHQQVWVVSQAIFGIRTHSVGRTCEWVLRMHWAQSKPKLSGQLAYLSWRRHCSLILCWDFL